MFTQPTATLGENADHMHAKSHHCKQNHANACTKRRGKSTKKAHWQTSCMLCITMKVCTNSLTTPVTFVSFKGRSQVWWVWADWCCRSQKLDVKTQKMHFLCCCVIFLLPQCQLAWAHHTNDISLNETKVTGVVSQWCTLVEVATICSRESAKEGGWPSNLVSHLFVFCFSLPGMACQQQCQRLPMSVLQCVCVSHCWWPKEHHFGW